MASGYFLPSDPHLWRWMLFVDGENLTMRAQDLAQQRDITLKPGKTYEPNVFIWLPGIPGRFLSGIRDMNLQPQAVRAYYYTSTTGADDEQKRIRLALW
jgi:hypothetical protein